MKKICILMSIVAFFCAVFMPQFACSAQMPSAGSNVSEAALFFKYKDISHNWRVIKKMKAQTNNLSDEEKSVLQKYVFGAVRGEDTYLLINCNLRNILAYYIPKSEITKPLKYRLDYYARSLSMPIAKTRLPQNMILYRGIDEKGMKYLFVKKDPGNVIYKPVNENNLEILKKQIEGLTYTENGFMMTSYDKNAAWQTKFMLEVYAPKNLQAVLIEDIGNKPAKQVLINKNSKWKVTGVRTEISRKTNKPYYMITIKYVL